MIEHFHAECDTLIDILARSPIIGQKGAQIGANSKNAMAHSLLHTQQEAKHYCCCELEEEEEWMLYYYYVFIHHLSSVIVIYHYIIIIGCWHIYSFNDTMDDIYIYENFHIPGEKKPKLSLLAKLKKLDKVREHCPTLFSGSVP